jgi:hypothetical protein
MPGKDSESTKGHDENADELVERQVMCSGCFQVVPESRVHVLPFFNTDMGRFVTTFRCEGCWLTALEETRARLAATDDATEIASAAAVFHPDVFLLEFQRGDPAPVVRELVLRMLDMLRSGAIRLEIGPTQPP